MKKNHLVSAAILLLIMTVTILVPRISASPAVDAAGTGRIEIADEGILLQFSVLGGTITEATDDGWESKYFIKGTASPGETIQIEASGHGTTMSQSNPVNEDLEATLSVWFDAGNGEENREVVTLAPGESGSVSSSFTVPDDVRSVKIFGIISNAWINPYGGGSRSLILNVEFEVVAAEQPFIGQVEEPETEPESGSSTSAANPTASRPISRVIIVVGIAIAGTLGVIAAGLARKAAASEEDEQPTNEIVYVLNPSHERFDMELNKPVTLTVTGYRVTRQGHQIEPGALINISLPPALAENFNLQTTGSNGQFACIITLLKMPSAASAALAVNGVFPHGTANTQVQLALKMEFAISPGNYPRIVYNQHEERWRVPELAAFFRDPAHGSPIRVGFYYGFVDPPLTFEPDILEVEESYTSDDGLTYSFKLNVRDGIDLETHFGEDLTKNDGRVTVSVIVKDEKGREYRAATDLQLSPQLRMIACSWGKNAETRGRRPSPYQGLELDDLEFIADGIDKLPLQIFFIRSDKEVTEGAEAEAVMDIVEVEKVEWTTTTSYEEPAVNSENSGGGFFAYDLGSSGWIAADKDVVNGVYALEVDARIRAGGPKNYTIDGSSLRFTVKPQFTLLRLWVVPGYARSTSEAIAYAKLLPSHKPFTGLKLTLESSGGGGATLNTSDGDEKVTQIMDPPPGGKVRFEMVMGTARWILTYSGLRWSSLPGAQFQVTCKGPRDKVGNTVAASDSFDVNANVTSMLSDLLSDSDIQAKLNNPYNFKENSAIPECLNGPLWNVYQWFDTNKPYVCHQMRSHIIDFLRNRRHFRGDGELEARLDSMRGMNGIEYENYYMYAVHVWAGFFLSGSSTSDYKALDPWWEQRWIDPSLNKLENLMTSADEAWNFSKIAASLGALAVAIASIQPLLTAAGAVALLRALLLGMTAASAVEAAGLTDILISSTVDYGTVASPVDNSVELFPRLWLTEFIPRLDQQDLDEWRKP